MLLKYIVSNYKSIGHPMEFSMFPVKKIEDERFVKKINTKAGEWTILRRGGFFGPNASGKTSFIESIRFARDYIVNGQKSGKGTGVNQFKGEFADLEEKSTFQFMFYIDGEVYDYGFSLGKQQVFEEWLMVLTESNFTPLFTRITDENGKTQIEIESKFARKGSKERNLAEVLKESIQQNQRNQLYLYKLYDNGVKKVETIVEWFKKLQIIFPTTKIKSLPLRLNQDDTFKEFVSRSLEKLDTGVEDISVASEEIDFHEFAEKINMPTELINEIEEIKSGIVSFGGKYFIFGEGNKRRTVLLQIKFEHLLNGKNINFNIEDESDGTKRLLDLLPMLFGMGNHSQSIYFVDEIDRSLHTKLSQYLLREFLNGCKDTYSQIVFTAHDVNLINLDDFKQGEIWFVEKNHFGESQLKPLSNFDLKEEQDVLKSYLCGRFGAVPVIKGEF